MSTLLYHKYTVNFSHKFTLRAEYRGGKKRNVFVPLEKVLTDGYKAFKVTKESHIVMSYFICLG